MQTIFLQMKQELYLFISMNFEDFGFDSQHGQLLKIENFALIQSIRFY